jgi:hypothetical protein
LTSLSVKQEEIHNQAVHASSNGSVYRNATFSTKSLTFPRRVSSSTLHEERQEEQEEEESPNIKINGLVLDLIDDPSASTAVEIERKRELLLQRQQERQEVFERRRHNREIENNKRDDERRRKDNEEAAKKIEREQRRDEIYKRYMMKKDKTSNPNDTTNDDHPIIKIRPKSSTVTTAQRPPIERRQTGRFEIKINESYIPKHC